MSSYVSKLQPIAAPAQPSYVDKLKPIAAPAAPSGPPPPPDPLASVHIAGNGPSPFGMVGDAFNSGAKQVSEGVNKMARPGQAAGNLPLGALKIAAGAISAVSAPLAPLTAPLGKGVQAIGDKIGDSPAVQKFALSKGGQYAEKAAQGLSDASVIAGTIAGAASPLGKGVKDTVVSAPKTVADTALAVKDRVSPPTNPDTLAGMITQGKTADIPKTKAAISAIDTTGVKTYADLKARLDATIKNTTQSLDSALSTNEEVKKLPDLTAAVKVGDTTVSHNYVQDAITQLKDHYKVTNDVAALEKINQLEAKANTTGLTVKEINDLARLHGQDLNAFNANGQAASGLTKQAAENTRTGLKDTARDQFGNPVFKEADTQLTGLIRTRDLVDAVAEQVNKLQQKIQPRGLGEKAGRLIGQVVNILGANSPKGFIEYFLGRGTGLKTLNALDLEAALQKNLKLLQEALVQNAPPATIESKLQQIIDAYQSNRSSQAPNEGKSLPTNNSTNATPLNTQKKTNTLNKNAMGGSVPPTK